MPIVAGNVFRMNTHHTPRTIAEALHRTIGRDPNPHATVRGALLNNTGPDLLLDVADPTGANGQRTFVVMVREVDPPEGNDAKVAALAALIESASRGGISTWETMAATLLNAGVTL